MQLVGILNTHSKHHFGSWCFVDSFLQLVGIFNNLNLYNSWFHFHKSWVFSILKICYHKATKHYLPMILFVSIGFIKQKTFRIVLEALPIALKTRMYSNYQECPKRPALPRNIKVLVSLELFGALYMYISGSNQENFHSGLYPIFSG